MCLHRLQMSPDLALNPMEKLDIMPIEFYASDYLHKVVLRYPRVCTDSSGSPT